MGRGQSKGDKALWRGGGPERPKLHDVIKIKGQPQNYVTKGGGGVSQKITLSEMGGG